MTLTRRAALSGNGQTQEPAVTTGQPRVHRPPVPIPDSREPRRIRIVQKGWETYTGNFGGVDFTDGLSDVAIPETFSDRICTQIRAVDAETGDSIGPQQRMIDARTARMPVAVHLEHATVTKQEQLEADAAVLVASGDLEAKQETIFYTYEELCVLVEKKGIQGLRDVALPYGVKARSIPDLIENILNAQQLAKKSAPVITE